MRMRGKSQTFFIFSLSLPFSALILIDVILQHCSLQSSLSLSVVAQPSDSLPTQSSTFHAAADVPTGGAAAIEPAVRVVRFRIDYPQAELGSMAQLANWPTVMRKSVLASLRFVNKHWLICGEETSADKNDCGKLQVTGEQIGSTGYRLNATFIANRDPIQNAKVDATSTVVGVIQIGLRGGIFQYTNTMKLLGKPRPELEFEEAFFCFPGFELVDGDKCQKTRRAQRAANASRHHRKHRRHSNIVDS